MKARASGAVLLRPPYLAAEVGQKSLGTNSRTETKSS